MHMLGTPRTMQDDPRYDDVVYDVKAFLAERIDAAVAAGVDPSAHLGRPWDRVRQDARAQSRAPPSSRRASRRWAGRSSSGPRGSAFSARSPGARRTSGIGGTVASNVLALGRRRGRLSRPRRRRGESRRCESPRCSSAPAVGRGRAHGGSRGRCAEVDGLRRRHLSDRSVARPRRARADVRGARLRVPLLRRAHPHPGLARDAVPRRRRAAGGVPAPHGPVRRADGGGERD